MISMKKDHYIRIFYYDCPPVEKGKNVYHPLTKRSVNLGKTELGKWMQEFLDELKHRRKVCFAFGTIGDKKET